MNRLIVLLSLAAVGFGSSACGEDDETSSATQSGGAAAAEASPEASPTAVATTSGASSTEAADSVVAAELDEWSIRPKPATVKAGSTEFETENVGAVVHELEVVKTDTAVDAFPVSGGKADVEAVGEEIGEIEDVAPGKTKEFAVDLEPGNYILICNLPAHYEQGMAIAFKVTE